ncbi:hypothetical protein ACWEQN_42010 [Streptomyces sp. NPDC004129]|uniref:hypothetical protein n=1 Tax=Streptomyces sp. NPDC004533 TaxID=3154278 RepID=UPI0033BD01E9
MTAVTANGEAIDPPTGRPDRVYITSDRDYACFYASRYRYGDLYTVEPVGKLETSTEDPFLSWCVPVARVVSVYTRAVQLTPGQRRSLLRRWTHADLARSRRAEPAATRTSRPWSRYGTSSATPNTGR